jgi:type IV pilus assembly protein PilB
MVKKRLGEILIEDGLISNEELKTALEYKKRSGYKLGTALVALRILAENQLTETLGQALGLEVIDLSTNPPSAQALLKIPADLAERFDLIPHSFETKETKQYLVVAMSDPLNTSALKQIEITSECNIKPVLASLSAIQRSIRDNYHQTDQSVTFPDAEKIGTEFERQIHGLLWEQDFGDNIESTQSLIKNELESLNLDEPINLNLPAPNENLNIYASALEYRFVALFKLLLEKEVISKKEYAVTLKNLLNNSL